LIHKRRLAVINVRDDGDITDFIHSRELLLGGEAWTIVGDRRRVKPPRRG